MAQPGSDVVRQLANDFTAIELFLPSYANHDGHDLENRPDPIEEIVLTDEEAAAMLPS